MTPTQRRILAEMARGAVIHTLTGLDYHAWAFDMKRPGFRLAILPSTLHRLYREGWIETVKEDWRGAHYRISRRGRRALREEERG